MINQDARKLNQNRNLNGGPKSRSVDDFKFFYRGNGTPQIQTLDKITNTT